MLPDGFVYFSFAVASIFFCIFLISLMYVIFYSKIRSLRVKRGSDNNYTVTIDINLNCPGNTGTFIQST